MSESDPSGLLKNLKHERFRQEYRKDRNGTQAAIRAGYSQNGAKTRAYEFLTLPKFADIQAAIAYDAAQDRATATETTGITKAWLNEQLMTNYKRAMQAEQILDDEGQPIGEVRYSGAVANKALQLLAQINGHLINRVETGEAGEFSRLKDDELDAEVAKEAEALGLTVAQVNDRRTTKGKSATKH